MSRHVESVVTFRSGSNALFGVLHEPENALTVGIVILVGGPQYRVGSHRMFVHMARAFASHRYPVLRFDFAGMGDSEGRFPGFESLNGDVAGAVEQLRRSCPYVQHLVLLGLCDGATAAAYYAGSASDIAGLILLNPWVHTESGEAKAYLLLYYPRRFLQRDFWRALLRGEVSVLAGVRDLLRKLRRALTGRTAPRSGGQVDFVARLRAALRAFSGRLLVVASENDFTAAEFRDVWTNDPSWAQVRESGRFVSLNGADHTLSSYEDMQRFCDVVRDWLKAAAWV